MKLKTLRSQFPSLPEPVIENHEGFLVVRDDLVEGGTKRRALTNMLANMPEKEVVYPVTAHGYGQLALAFAGADTGKKVTLFMAKRKNYKDVPIVRETMEKTDAEYHLVQFPNFLNVVMARAKTYVENTPGAKLMPLGFDTQEFSDELAKIAKRLPLKKPPKEVWLAAGTGALARALKKAWPKAQINVVTLGMKNTSLGDGGIKVYKAPEKFDQKAKNPPPYPSAAHYDAKVWQFVKKHAKKGALIWNVGK